MQSKQIIKNYIYNSFYQCLVLLAPLITTPYVSRILGATGIGIYSYTQSIATYFVLLGSVGSTLYGQREIAYVQSDLERRTQIFCQITLFRFMTALVCTFVYFCAFCTDGKYIAVYRILTLEVLATAFDVSWFFMGLEKFRLTVMRNAAVKLIGIILVFLLVKSSDDILIYTLCLTLPIFIGNISLWVSLPKYLVKTHVNWKGVVKHIRPMLVLFIPQLAVEVYVVLDKTMLGVLSSNIDEVGYYTQASKIVKVILMLVTSLGTVMLPAMSAAFAVGKMNEIVKSIQKAFQFVFLIGFALLFGLCGVAKNFVPFFFGQGYDEVTRLIVIISPILILIAISNVIGKQYLLPTKQERAYTISVVSGAIVNFVLNWLLILRLNAIGASVATVFAELTVTLVQIICVRNQVNLKACFLPGVKYCICGAIMCAVIYTLGEILNGNVGTLVLQAFAGIAVYCGALIVTKDTLLKEGIDLLCKRIWKMRKIHVKNETEYKS